MPQRTFELRIAPAMTLSESSSGTLRQVFSVFCLDRRAQLSPLIDLIMQVDGVENVEADAVKETDNHLRIFVNAHGEQASEDIRRNVRLKLLRVGNVSGVRLMTRGTTPSPKSV